MAANRGVKILIIDDSEQDSLVIRRLLEKDGFTVTEANALEPALEAIDSSFHAVVLADLFLAHRRGTEVVDVLAPKCREKNCQIIAVTQLTKDQLAFLRRELILRGVETVISKDDMVQHLVSAVEEVLYRRQRDLQQGPLQVAAAISTMADAMIAEVKGVREICQEGFKLVQQVVSEAETSPIDPDPDKLVEFQASTQKDSPPESTEIKPEGKISWINAWITVILNLSPVQQQALIAIIVAILIGMLGQIQWVKLKNVSVEPSIIGSEDQKISPTQKYEADPSEPDTLETSP